MVQIGDAKGEYRGTGYHNDAELKAWLAKRPSEAALEPELPIIDPHHHFWDTPQRGHYLLPELLADIGGGHNIIATVFLECRSMYRKDSPAEMAPVGEVEFVNGIAAMSALPRAKSAGVPITPENPNLASLPLNVALRRRRRPSRRAPAAFHPKPDCGDSRPRQHRGFEIGSETDA